MTPEMIESVVVAILSLITGAGGVHAWNRRKSEKFMKMDDMLLTVGDHEKGCQKRWADHQKLFNLEIREAIREGFADGAAEIHAHCQVRINKLEDEQEKQRERLDRMRDLIKTSYGSAHIVGGVEPG